MQYIDNDMDDLFRKAEENYPLRTDGANWEAVQAKMAAAADDTAVAPARSSRRRSLWLLLLLLPLAFVLYRNDRTGYTAANSGIGIENTGIQKDSAANKQIDAGLSLKDHGKAETDGPSGSGHANGGAKINDRVSQARITGKERENILPGDRGENNNGQTTARHFQGKETKQADIFKPQPAENNHKKISEREEQPKNEGSAAGSYHPEIFDENDLPVDSTTPISQPKAIDSVSINKADTVATVKAQPKKVTAREQKGFYYGVVAGPDISTIKSQKVTHIGYTVGGLLGYKINNHWAVEAGVLWDRKKYYSDGKYFDKARTGIPPAATVMWLDGSCSMFEFPVAVKYDLALKKNSVFFTGGLTSYVMKNEAYAYEATYGTGYYEGFRTYKNSGSHLFSNLQLSAGYQYNFSRTFSLRIEPYIKLAIKDIGIGHMPIGSKGLYIGIIRNIR